MPSMAGREALEIETGVIPIDLRIEERAIAEIAKIQSKAIREPVKQQLLRFQGKEQHDQIVTPMGKALIQAMEMEKETRITIKVIEPEYTYRPGSSCMTLERPSYWNRLGSSKSRTAEQQQMCLEVADELVGPMLDRQVIAYTDGSCMNNPGPCGAGAIIYAEHLNWIVRLKRPVAERGSILLAELVASSVSQKT